MPVYSFPSTVTFNKYVPYFSLSKRHIIVSNVSIKQSDIIIPSHKDGKYHFFLFNIFSGEMDSLPLQIKKNLEMDSLPV